MTLKRFPALSDPFDEQTFLYNMCNLHINYEIILVLDRKP